jgi:hypothetical protein
MEKYFKEKLKMQNDNTNLIKTDLSTLGSFGCKNLEGLRSLLSRDPPGGGT